MVPRLLEYILACLRFPGNNPGRFLILSDPAAKHGCEGRIQGLFHSNTVLIRHNHPFQFRDLAAFGPQINRLDINERFLNRYYQQVAPDDFRTPLIP